ncbi:fibronectin type III-like domain-contianing protein [Oerskovia sp. M15]
MAVPIDRRSLQYWDVEANEWVTPTGTVPLLVGSSSADIRATGEIVVPSDTTAPTVEITSDPAAPNGTQGWYTEPVTLTFSATDDQDPAPQWRSASTAGSSPCRTARWCSTPTGSTRSPRGRPMRRQRLGADDDRGQARSHPAGGHC